MKRKASDAVEPETIHQTQITFSYLLFVMRSSLLKGTEIKITDGFRANLRGLFKIPIYSE